MSVPWNFTSFSESKSHYLLSVAVAFSLTTLRELIEFIEREKHIAGAL